MDNVNDLNEESLYIKQKILEFSSYYTYAKYKTLRRNTHFPLEFPVGTKEVLVFVRNKVPDAQRNEKYPFSFI